jgi:2-oxoglutarate ferredoxin oxidoreductase subunit beta
MPVVFERTKGLTPRETHYCPGCTHGIIHRLVAEVLEEMELLGDAIGVAPVGCAVFAYNYFNCDMHEAAHGRAPAMATGVKRVHPDKTVFSYQGDGDLASIGMAEIMHAANRGERVSIVFVNNTVYGMTGGQMAPTTMVGQKTTTCPGGRCREREGEPFRMAEIIGGLGGVAYAARTAVNTVKNIAATRRGIKRAFEVQLEDRGFGFVEVLATCPTNWKMTPVAANERIAREMIPYFPLGVFRDAGQEEEA